MNSYCDACNNVIDNNNLGVLVGPFRYCLECWNRYKETGEMRKIGTTWMMKYNRNGYSKWIDIVCAKQEGK